MGEKTDSIQVAIRIRPFINREKEASLNAQWGVQDNVIFQKDQDGDIVGEPYCVDHIFKQSCTNAVIYDEMVQPFIASCVSGVHSTIFTYGQTSSGKTYTMLGNEDQEKGILQHAVEDIFRRLQNKTFLMKVNYIEIYNEKIIDLLTDTPVDIKFQTLATGGVALKGATEGVAATKEQVYHFLKIGAANRHIGSTKMNDRSSRSHTVFRLILEINEVNAYGQTCRVFSCLNLVDLAGSERVAQTKATGIRLKEGTHINKSLSTLTLVIKQLSEGSEFINFRDSKLTRLLQESLGGNAKTLIISNVTLASLEDTHSTLAFSQRAKVVKNRPKINKVSANSDTYKALTDQNVELKVKLEEQLRINKEQSEFCKRQLNTLNTFAPKTEQPLDRNRRHTICFTQGKRPLVSISEDNEVFCDDMNSTTPVKCASNYRRLEGTFASGHLGRFLPPITMNSLQESCTDDSLSKAEERSMGTQTSHETNESISTDLTDISGQLMILQEILNNPDVNSPLQYLNDTLNVKLTTSRDVIEAEIEKQLNRFNTSEKLNDLVGLPSEVQSFHELIQKFSSIENDFSLHDMNGEENVKITDMRFLVRIYEVLLKKNTMIEKCSEQIVALEKSDSENELKEQIFEREAELVRKNELINEYSKQIEMLMETTDDFRHEQVLQENKDLKERINDLTTRISKQETEATKENPKISDLNQEVISLREARDTYLAENELLKQEKEIDIMEINTLKAEITKLKNSSETVFGNTQELNEIILKRESELLNKNNLINEYSKQIEILTETRDGFGNEPLNPANEELKTQASKIEYLTTLISEKEIEVTKGNHEISDLKQQSIILEATIEALKQEKETDTVKINILTDEINELKKDSTETSTDEIKELKDIIQQRESELLNKSNLINEYTNQIEMLTKTSQANEEIKTQVSRIEDLTTLISEKEIEIMEGNSAISDLKQQLIILEEAKDNYFTQIEALKQERETDTVKINTLTDEISELKRCSAETLTDKVKELKDIIQERESELLNKNDLINEYSNQIEMLTDTRNSFCNQQLEQTNKVQQENDDLKANVISQESKIIELTQIISEKETEIAKGASIITHLKQQLIILKEAKNSDFTQIEALKGKMKSDIVKINTLKDKITDVKRRSSEAFADQMEELKEIIQKKDSELMEKTNLIDEYLNQIQALTEAKDLRNEVQETKNLKAELILHVERINDLTVKISDKETEVIKGNFTINRLKQQITTLEQVRDKYFSQIGVLGEERKNYIIETNKLKDEILDLKRSSAELDSKTSRYEYQLNEKQRVLFEIKRDAKLSQEELQKRVHSLSASNAKLTKQEESLRSKIKDFDVIAEKQAKTAFKLNEKICAYENQIEDLQSEIILEKRKNSSNSATSSKSVDNLKSKHIAEVQELISKHQLAVGNYEKKIQELNQTVVDSSGKIECKNDVIRRLETKLAESQGIVQELEADVRNQSQKIGEQRREISSLTTMKNKFNTKVEQLQVEVADLRKGLVGVIPTQQYYCTDCPKLRSDLEIQRIHYKRDLENAISKKAQECVVKSNEVDKLNGIILKMQVKEIERMEEEKREKDKNKKFSVWSPNPSSRQWGPFETNFHKATKRGVEENPVQSEFIALKAKYEKNQKVLQEKLKEIEILKSQNAAGSSLKSDGSGNPDYDLLKLKYAKAKQVLEYRLQEIVKLRKLISHTNVVIKSDIGIQCNGMVPR